jgi:predicted oxidoreductase
MPSQACAVPLTPSGPRISSILAGAWRMVEWKMSVPERVRWMEQALDLGITSFDHADIYGDYQVEAQFGEALAASPGLRRRMQIVTKCGIRLPSARRPGNSIKSYDTSRAHVLASVDASLRALRTGHIELLLIHRPDALMDPEELAATFRELQAAGKVGYFGVSNHSPSQLALLHRHHPLVTHQVEFSVLELAAASDGTLDQGIDLGMRPMAWSPLAGGRLFADGDARAARVRGVLGALAGERGVSVATMAYAWILRHPSKPLPITGSGRARALAEAVAALDVTLTREDWYRVWQASTGREVP